MKFFVRHKDMFRELRSFCLVCVLLAGWLGEVNLRKYVAVISITDLHVTVTWCISLTLICITRPKFDSLLPALDLPISIILS